jgi:prepilin-type N-terminal cleavage/methylation domain-containing protein
MVVHAPLDSRRPLSLRKTEEAGFTLFEMLVAIAILGGSLVAILSLFSGSLNLSRQTHRSMEARVLAQGLLAEAMAPGPESAREKHGTTASGLFWRVRLRPYRGSREGGEVRAALVQVEVQGPQQDRPASYTLTGLVFQPNEAPK